VPAVPITRSPRASPICTAAIPTPPLAPCTSIVCDGRARARCTKGPRGCMVRAVWAHRHTNSRPLAEERRSGEGGGGGGA
jgi:hypothetical protein